MGWGELRDGRAAVRGRCAHILVGRLVGRGEVDVVGGEQAEQERDNTAEDHKHAAEGRALRRRQDGGAECLVQRLLLLAHLGARRTPELSRARWQEMAGDGWRWQEMAG